MTPMPTGPVPPLAATLVLTLVVFSLLWLIHVRRRDAGVVDWWWGPGFAAIAWTEAPWAPAFGPVQIIVSGAVTLWAARLASHLVVRHRARGGAEDPRYAALRAAGGPNWGRTNLVTVFWLQALVQWGLAAPVHVALLAGSDGPLGPGTAAAVAAGTVLFAAGLAIEWIADRRLAAFAADPRNRGRLLTDGPFAWCRHPNYFGEALAWWGIGLVAAAGTGVWAVLAAPAALTFLLARVSGVPPLEAQLSGRPGFAEWAARTPALLPRRPPARR